MQKLISSYLTSERGAVYVVVLGTSIICFGFIGLMFDAGRIYIEHTRLQHFVDRTALAAAVELDGKEDAIARAQQVIDSEVLTQRALYTSGDGQNFEVDAVRFYTRHPGIKLETLPGEENAEDTGETDEGQEASFVAVSVKPRHLSWSLLGAYSTSLANMEFGAEAVASNSGTYSTNNLEFMFAVDVSQSMLIGATAADVDKLTDLHGCAFACHIRYERDGVNYVDDPVGAGHKPVEDPNGTIQTRYEHALENGVRFRLNAAEDALNDALIRIDALRSVTSARIDVDVRTFALDLSDEPVSTGGSGPLKLEVFMPEPAEDIYSSATDHTTDPEVVFEQLARELDNKLLNKEPSDQLLLTIVTDGVASYLRSGGSIRRVFNPEECDVLKNKGVDIAVIYLEYLPAGRLGTFSGDISEIEPNLQACASGDLFFKTTFEEDIFEAFEQLVQPIGGLDVRTRLVQ
ncbi:MAG: Tad domain-containing protein [Rhodobacteraceae bacterium]|nr:Tad domain-containing protein [Paracoccaceae bacterium]